MAVDRAHVIWTAGDVSFDLVEEMTAETVVTLLVSTPVGTLTFAAEPVFRERVLTLQGTHVQGLSPNAIGWGNLKVIAQALMERMEVDELVVEGALRTTGANPGHKPRHVRFFRRDRP